jgi:hypothetical protein
MYRGSIISIFQTFRETEGRIKNIKKPLSIKEKGLKIFSKVSVVINVGFQLYQK